MEQMPIGIQVQQYVQALLIAWITRTKPNATSPDQVALTLGWAIFGTALQAARTKHKQSPDEVLALLASGIAPYFAAEQ